jgi:hypothetical protein
MPDALGAALRGVPVGDAKPVGEAGSVGEAATGSEAASVGGGDA